MSKRKLKAESSIFKINFFKIRNWIIKVWYCVISENIESHPKEGYWKFRGGGGSQKVNFWNKKGFSRRGNVCQNTFCDGGMDIYWNNTFWIKGHENGLALASRYLYLFFWIMPWYTLCSILDVSKLEFSPLPTGITPTRNSTPRREKVNLQNLLQALAKNVLFQRLNLMKMV